MEVWEKINYLIEEKKMNKKEFINKLLELEPKLKSTGETPKCFYYKWLFIWSKRN